MKNGFPEGVEAAGKKIVFLTLFILGMVSTPILLKAEEPKGADDTAVKIEGTGKEAVAKDVKTAAEDDPGYQTQDRIIFSRTAISNRPRDLHLTGYAAGIWDIDFTVNPNVAVGIAVQLPICSLGAIPHVTVNTYVTRNFAVGAGLFAGAWAPYISNSDLNILMAFGGHAAATWTKGPHMVNFSIMAADYGGFSKKSKFDVAPGLGVLATFGYRYSINKNWAFLLEVHTPFVFNFNESMSWNCSNYRYGEMWAVMYGFRGQGGQVFGDIGFILPLQKDYVKQVWMYLPLGIPYFSIGMKF